MRKKGNVLSLQTAKHSLGCSASRKRRIITSLISSLFLPCKCHSKCLSYSTSFPHSGIDLYQVLNASTLKLISGGFSNHTEQYVHSAISVILWLFAFFPSRYLTNLPKGRHHLASTLIVVARLVTTSVY